MTRARLIIHCILLVSIAMLFSCKKKSDNPGDNPSNVYRVTQQRDYANNIMETRYDYTYSGNLLSEILMYEQGTTTNAGAKLAVEYNGGNISKISVFVDTNGVWSIMEEVIVNSYTGSLPAERIIKTYDDTGTLTNQIRYTDTYLNGQVSEEKSYSMQSGSWELEDRDTYTYNAQGQLQKIGSYSGSGDLGSTTTYTWQNNLIVSELSIKTDSSMLHNVIYDYSGTRLIKASRSFYVNNSWTPTGTTDYVYDANGNLVSQTDNYVPASDVFKTEFDYTAAQGNFRQVFTVMGAAELWNGAPDPMPTKSSGLPSGQIRSAFGLSQ
ncbi:MAG: hypothetical protein NTY96_02175 [Bacteroidetes bacterium]|nr:hypothetical protein [Bacteroidota bacterium]